MEKELDCEIVQDLLPLYVDGMVNEISKRSIESHLKNCTGCSEIYRNMTVGIEEKSQSDIKDVKTFLKRTKLITGDYEWNQDLWNLHIFMENGLVEVIGAILFGIIGRSRKGKK